MTERGFSMIEVLIAAAIMSAAIIVLAGLVGTAQRVASAQPEAADMYQRLRVVADMLQRDLLMAGAGLVHGTDGDPLVSYLAPIVPMRTGARSADPELSFFTDRISILSVLDPGVAAPLLTDMGAPTDQVPVDASGPGCPATGVCGFDDGTRALILDVGGVGRGFDVFSVSGTAGGLAHGPPDREFTRAYRKGGTRVMPVRERVYHLDRLTKRLMVYDGYKTDVPLAENIVSLAFEYFLDPWPASVSRPLDASGSCVYSSGATPAALLKDLGTSVLSPASAALLTDGPVCGVSPHRFDGDLLRIRRVRVTIRAEVSDVTLRGRGSDYWTTGLATGSSTSVPDIAVTFDVSPRNLRATR